MGNLFEYTYKGMLVSCRKGNKSNGEVFYDAWLNDQYIGMHPTTTAILNCIDELQRRIK